MKNKSKVLLSSLATIAMCGSLIVGSTYALFTDTAKVNVAVTAGKVEVNASLNSLTTYSMDYGTPLDKITAAGDAKFENGGVATWVENSNEIALTNITPGDMVELVLTVENSSNVDVIYQAKLSKDTSLDETGNEKDNSLFDALQVYVMTCDPTDPEGEEDWDYVYVSSNGWEHDYTGPVWQELAAPQSEGEKSVSKVMIQIMFPNGDAEHDNQYQGASAHLVYTVMAQQANAPLDSEEYVYTDDGMLVSGDGTLMGVSADVETLVIPSNVTKIGQGAFRDNKTIKSVVIPDSVTEIGGAAFSSCSALESIEIPDSVTTIGQGAFMYCTALKEIEIPASVTSLGNSVFAMNPFAAPAALEKVVFAEGSKIESIPSQAFQSCAGLTTVVLPDTIKSIGDSAFNGTALTSFEFTDSLETIGKGAFAGTNLMEVHIPASVKSISDSAFSSCENLTSFTIAEESTAKLGQFMLVNSLVETVIVPENVTLGVGVFRQAKQLKTVTFKGQIDAIPEFTFADCKLLETVTFEKNTQVPKFLNNALGSQASGTSAFRFIEKLTFVMPNFSGELNENGQYIIENVGYTSGNLSFYTTITVVTDIANAPVKDNENA